MVTPQKRRSRRRERPISTLQAHVLGVLNDVGDASAHEISRHLLVDGSRLGSALRGLEGRGMIGRVYSGHRYPGEGHAYTITADGRDAASAAWGDDEGDE